MAKYLIVYKGEATDMSEMSKEEMDKVNEGWKMWMEKMGDAVADIGAPMTPSFSVVDDGSDGSAVAMSGYSIIEASDDDDAKAKVSDHPFLSEGKGDYAIDVYELGDVPLDM